MYSTGGGNRRVCVCVSVFVCVCMFVSQVNGKFLAAEASATSMLEHEQVWENWLCHESLITAPLSYGTALCERVCECVWVWVSGCGSLKARRSGHLTLSPYLLDVCRRWPKCFMCFKLSWWRNLKHKQLNQCKSICVCVFTISSTLIMFVRKEDHSEKVLGSVSVCVCVCIQQVHSNYRQQ